MANSKVDYSKYGVKVDDKTFVDNVVDLFNATVRGQHSVDELLLHPKEALAFCELVRNQYGLPDLPDHEILRALMKRRKNP